MTDMTLKEIVNEFSKKMLDLNPECETERIQRNFFNECPKEPDWEDWYCRIDDAEIDVTLGTFIAIITVVDSEGEEYEFKTNSLSGRYLDCWISYDHFESDDAYSLKDYIREAEECFIDRECATYTLEALQEELTDEVLQNVYKGHHVVSFKYLLANPRRDVVEWALKHKEELGLTLVKPEFVGKYQAVPELKELILNTLEKKGE